MTTFIFTLALFAFAMVAMAAGVILSNRELQGSCGGVGSEDCLCSLEKRRICALAEKAERAQAKKAGDMSYADMTRLMGGDDKHGHPHDHTH